MNKFTCLLDSSHYFQKCLRNQLDELQPLHPGSVCLRVASLVMVRMNERVRSGCERKRKSQVVEPRAAYLPSILNCYDSKAQTKITFLTVLRTTSLPQFHPSKIVMCTLKAYAIRNMSPSYSDIICVLFPQSWRSYIS